MRRYVDITDIEIPSDENIYEELVAFADAIAEQDIIELPEQKRGEWIEHEWAEEVEGLLVSNYECSCCHLWERKDSDFCPNCGADMRGEASQ